MASMIAAQLYTLRQFTRTPADIARTLRKVREIGYESVQVSGLGPIAPRELAAILRSEGLSCCATHVPIERMEEQTDAVIEEHHILECRYTAVPSIPTAYRQGDLIPQFARLMEGVARKLKHGGLTLAFHNHGVEFARTGGRTWLDIIYQETDPSLLTAELDTYWVQYGGGDPAAWIGKLKGRSDLIHLKDMVFGPDNAGADSLQKQAGETDEDFARRQQRARAPQPIMAEVGEGNLNWPAILSACGEAGVKWYIVEQDVCQRDPFESLAISLRNLRTMGLT